MNSDFWDEKCAGLTPFIAHARVNNMPPAFCVVGFIRMREMNRFGLGIEYPVAPTFFVIYIQLRLKVIRHFDAVRAVL